MELRDMVRGIDEPDGFFWRAAGWICCMILLLVILAITGCASEPVDMPCGYAAIERDAGVVKYLKVYCVGTEV